MNPRDRLVTRLAAEPEPQIVPIAEFLADNDDLGSIGCNLLDHPGLDAFREVFAALASRPDVTGIYAQIAELDPGEGCWPFADTVYVLATIPHAELLAAVAPLQPDEVGPVPPDQLPLALATRGPVHLLWWD
jgi:hypothetical protein